MRLYFLKPESLLFTRQINQSKQFSLFIFLIFITMVSKAQEIKRAELDLNDDLYYAMASPVNEYGLLCQQYAEKKSNLKGNCQLDFYSSDLIKLETELLTIEARCNAAVLYRKDEKIYTLYTTKSNRFTLVTADLKTFKTTQISGAIPSNTSIFQFIVLGNYAYLRAMVGKQTPLLQINLATGRLEEFPIRIKDTRERMLTLKDIQVLNNELLLFIRSDVDSRTVDLYLSKYDIEGKPIKAINLTKKISEKIISVKTSNIDGKIILSGTYSKTTDDYSQGIFFAELLQDEVVNFKPYNFLHLKTPPAYLSQKEQSALVRKSGHLEEKNTELLMNTLMVIHAAEKSNNGYIIVGEMYTANYWGNIVSYLYNQAILLKLSTSGELIWDENLKMDLGLDYGYNVSELVSVTENPAGDISMAFVNKNVIISKSVNSSGKVIKEKKVDLNALNNNKTKRTFSTVEHWYSNYYIASGFLKNASAETKEKKNVFFLNKISLEE